MKVIGLGNNGFISTEVRDALGLPRHVRQATVLIVAPTKKAAAEFAQPRGFTVSLRDPDTRIATGNDVDALAAAGLLDEPAVYVTPMSGFQTSLPGVPVVKLDGAGNPHLIGRLERNERGYGYRFVPEEG